MTVLRRITDALRSAFTGKAGLLRVLAIVAVMTGFVVAFPHPVDACSISDPLSCVAMIFVKIFQLLTGLMGIILVLEVEALIRVAQFFNFVSPGPTAVQIGWVVTRDLANMFFIVILLIIAFGTILGSSTYHYSKNLPRLLIMAVVINFSKTICGIFIDIGQVVMLTFVNAFKETAAGNFMNAYQINKLLALGNASTYDFGMVIAMMFAFILVTIAVCVTLVLLVIILFRVVMLWILIILSPIAFLTSAIPRGGDYYAKWWGEFKKYIITGPIIAFFMWLALASVQGVGPGGFASQGFPASYAGAGESAAAANAAGAAGKIPTEAGKADTIMNMVIAICIMFAGLKYAADSGTAGAGFAKSVRGGLEKTGRNIAAYGMKRAAEPVVSTVGKGLARVPLVGGLGRNLALTGEKWKKERQAAREKFSGTPEDVARLSPGAYGSKIQSLSKSGNTKELKRWMDAGLSNPSIAKRLDNPYYGAGGVQSLIQNAKGGKELQDAAGMLMNDKRVGSWAKVKKDAAGNAVDAAQADAATSLLTSTYDRLSKEADSDPNLKKTFSDFKQKFAPQLVDAGKIGDSDLKEIAPKMSNDDVMGLGKGDMKTFMPHLTSNQLKKLAEDGTPDQQTAMLDHLKPEMLEKMSAGSVPASWYGNADVAKFVMDKTRGDGKARAEAMTKDKNGDLARSADARLAKALASGDKAEFTAALPDALSVGSLTAATINSDAKLQAAIKENANQIDLGAVGRNVSVTSKDRTDAGKALSSLIGSVNPDKVKNARKGGMNDHILASAAEAESATASAREAQRSSLNEDAPTLLANLVEQQKALGASLPADASPAATAEMGRLENAIKDLRGSMDQQQSALKDLGSLRERIGRVNSGSEKMSAPDLEALKNAANGFEKQLERLENSIAKTVADMKGVKFDSGEKRGKSNRQS